MLGLSCPLLTFVIAAWLLSLVSFGTVIALGFVKV